MCKKLSKYIASFDYFDKSLILLSATSGGVSFPSFATVIGAPVGIASESSSLAFSISTGIVKNVLKTKWNKKKKYNKIIMPVRSTLNSKEKIISKALIDNNEISHGNFETIVN